MEHDRMIDQLPDMLAVALRLDDADYPAETISAALGIPVQSVPNLLVVARCKLDNLATDQPTGRVSWSSTPPASTPCNTAAHSRDITTGPGEHTAD